MIINNKSVFKDLLVKMYAESNNVPVPVANATYELIKTTVTSQLKEATTGDGYNVEASDFTCSEVVNDDCYEIVVNVKGDSFKILKELTALAEGKSK